MFASAFWPLFYILRSLWLQSLLDCKFELVILSPVSPNSCKRWGKLLQSPPLEALSAEDLKETKGWGALLPKVEAESSGGPSTKPKDQLLLPAPAHPWCNGYSLPAMATLRSRRRASHQLQPEKEDSCL